MLAGMIESRSLSFALTVAGGAALVVIFAVAMLIQPVPQGYLEYKCGFGSAGAGRAARSVYDLDRAGMVRTAMFYVAIIAFAFGCTSGMMVISQVSAIMQESFALTATQAAFYVSIMSFMSMSGRFLWGIVTDHFDKYITLSIICGLPVIAMGVLAVSDAMMVAVACLAVTALCYGGFGSTITHDAGKRAQGGFGREVNDSTFSLVSHYIGKYHCRENCSEQIQVYHLTESVDVQVENRAVRSDGRASHITAGCIQQCIDTTIFGQDIFFVLFQNFFF